MFEKLRSLQGHSGLFQRNDLSKFHGLKVEISYRNISPLTRSNFGQFLKKSEKENHTWHVSIISAPPCPTDYMIRFVKSSPFNFELRNLVRSHIRNQHSKFNRTFFLIGTVPGEDSRKNKLKDEIKRFNDFIIGDFIDAYRNVTRKSFTAYR